jgi:hypothetical protein
MQKTKQKTKQKQELVQLVDESFFLDTEIKEKSKMLNLNKDKLKEIATAAESESISGELGECRFSSDTRTEIEPRALFNLMVDMGMEEDFFSLVSVKVADTRKKLGEMMLTDIEKTTIKPYNRITFKGKK